MISQADLHTITDKIAGQVYSLRTNLADQTTTAGTSDIAGSLAGIVDALITGGDQNTIPKLIPKINSLQSAIDFETLTRGYYSPLVAFLDSFLKGTSTVSYSGLSKFCVDNSGTRYSSEFMRAATLAGISIYLDSRIYYDQADNLGSYTVSGAGTGAWVASAFAWDSDVDGTYGGQPSTGLEVETKTIIGATPIVVHVDAVDVFGNLQKLTANIPDLTVANSTIDLENLSGSDKYIVDFKEVRIEGGTAADAFDINYKPIRTIGL